MLWLIILVIVILYVYHNGKEVSRLEEENKRLKRQLEEISLMQSNSSNSLVNTIVDEKNDANTNKIITEIIKEKPKEEKVKVKVKEEKTKETLEREKRERKNTSILITGALLIVLAAIVFLMSTWNSISNVIKSIVLVLLVGVFLGASKIAKEKYKLEKTSDTFFYIAMAYIPICFLAFSVFELFGYYLSIHGEGKYTYLAVSMLLNSAIYYYYFKSRNDKILFYGSILSQILGLVLFGLIFGNNVYFITSILLLYNIALILFTKNDKDLELLKYFCSAIPYITSITLLPLLFESTKYMMLLLILLTINFFLLYFKKNKNTLNAYLSNISLYLLGLYFIIIYEAPININLRIIIGLAHVITALIAEGYIFSKNKEQKILKYAMVTSVISLTVILIWRIIENDELIFIAPFVISMIETLVTFVMFVKSKNLGKTITSYLIPTFFIITIVNVFAELDANYNFSIIALLMIFAMGQLIKGEELEKLRKGFLVITNIFLTSFYFFNGLLTHEFRDDVVYFILITVVYMYSFMKYRNYVIFKYLSYIACNYVLLSMMNFVGASEEIRCLIPALVNTGIVFAESKYKFLQDRFSSAFQIIFQIISYFYLIKFGELKSIFIAMIYSAFLVYENLKADKASYLRILTYLGFLYTASINGENGEYFQIILIIATAVLSSITVYKKRITIDTIFSGIYLWFSMALFRSPYIKETLLFLWSIANIYFVNTNKEKDVFKTITYGSVLLFYETFINDLNFYYSNSLKVIGILVFFIVMIKDIVSKYAKNIDTIEYLLYILTNIFALMIYIDEKDGMIYVLFLVALLIYSYSKKYGVLFIVSMFTILANAIILTREFWFSVPWWIYLLLIGTILIAFAVKNESNENKQKRLNVGNMIKNLKEKIER